MTLCFLQASLMRSSICGKPYIKLENRIHSLPLFTARHQAGTPACMHTCSVHAIVAAQSRTGLSGRHKESHEYISSSESQKNTNSFKLTHSGYSSSVSTADALMEQNRVSGLSPWVRQASSSERAMDAAVHTSWSPTSPIPQASDCLRRACCSSECMRPWHGKNEEHAHHLTRTPCHLQQLSETPPLLATQWQSGSVCSLSVSKQQHAQTLALKRTNSDTHAATWQHTETATAHDASLRQQHATVSPATRASAGATAH